MYIDHIDWDDEDDPRGNVQHIADAGLSRDEVEEVLRAHPGGPDAYSESSGDPMIFGTSSAGRRIAIIYLDESDDLIIIYPITAYTVPEYGG